MRRFSALLSTAVAVLVLHVPAGAGAAERFAAPDGDGSAVDCLESDPCSLVDAINSVNAQPGDTVHVLPGTHAVTETLVVGADLIVDGAGSTETTIVPSEFAENLMQVTGLNAEVRDLTLDQSGIFAEGSPLVIQNDAVVHSVRALGSAGFPFASTGCSVIGGEVLITDTLCTGGKAGLFAAGALSTEVTVRNVTALGLGWTTLSATPGDTYGILAEELQEGEETIVDALNTIASGETADVRARTGGSLTEAEVLLDFSNFATVSTEGSGTATVSAAGSSENQTEEPIFFDAENLDFRQVEVSPTVDSGDETDLLLGTLDFEGDPRFGFGTSVDIGADEYVDGDGDGIVDSSDNCPLDENNGQENQDGDSAGDACDAFPLDPTETADTDEDGTGDNGDNCPATANPGQEDLDEDSAGDACDPDIDGDGTANGADAFPFDPTEDTDSDGDGIGDNGDNCPLDENNGQENQDGDSAGDACDAFPLDPTETADTDEDGTGDNGDNCPATANPGQEDLDEDSAGDACDPDIDGDGTANGADAFPFDPTEDTDSDGDGIGDNSDPTPNGEEGESGGDPEGGNDPVPVTSLVTTPGPTLMADITPPALKILARKLRLNRKGIARVRLRCPASEPSGPCRGTLLVRTARKLAVGKGKKRRLLLAKARFKIASGRSARVRIKLSGRKLRLVKRSRAARKVTLTAKVRDGAGNRKAVDRRATLLRS